MSEAVSVTGFILERLPLGLFLYVRSWEVFGILGAGVAFVWPVLRVVQRNKPQIYAPSHVPHDLLP